MFAGNEHAAQWADEAAEFFGTHKTHQSHGVGIFRDRLRQLHLTVDNLEDTLQDEVLSVFHSTIITFQTSTCVKLVENNDGRGMYTHVMPQVAVPRRAPKTGHLRALQNRPEVGGHFKTGQ